jgi:TnpA family transposase
MMKKLASYPKQNGLAKALRKLVASKGHCLCWTGSGSFLRRRIQAGLNKGEARNACSRSLYAPAGGNQRSGTGKPELSGSGLTLLTAAISLWNTVYIERAIDYLKQRDPIQ